MGRVRSFLSALAINFKPANAIEREYGRDRFWARLFLWSFVIKSLINIFLPKKLQHKFFFKFNSKKLERAQFFLIHEGDHAPSAARGVGNWFESRTLVPRIAIITDRIYREFICQIWLQWVQNHGNLALGQLVANPSLLALFLKWSRVCIMHKKQKNCASSISRYKIDRRTGCERKMSLKSN